MVLVHSTTKGFAAMVMALAHSRGWLDYDERVCTYWPEFAQAGKEQHHGPPAARASGRVVRLRREGRPRRRCRPRSAWRRSWRGSGRRGSRANGRPTTRSVSASTKASSCGGSTRRIAAWAGSSPRRSPDLSVSSSTSACRSRSPTLAWRLSSRPASGTRLTGMPLRLTLRAMNRRSVLHRSLVANPGTGFYVDPRHVVVRNLEVPSGGGVGTARAIARRTECSPAAAASSGCVPRRSRRSRRRRSRRATASSTSASADRRSSRSGS